MQNITLRCRGLYTFPNNLSEVPEGALNQANNVVIDRDGVITPRRGHKIYGQSMFSSNTRAKQLLTYKQRVIRHFNTTLEWDSDAAGTFSAIDTGFTEAASGVRTKHVESNGNLYLTSSKGIRKLSAKTAADIGTATLVNAGAPKALDGIANLNPQTGFLLQDSACAYRVLWGYRDANNNVILGSPSERILIYNFLLDLLIADFNKLVSNLSTAAAADAGDDLSDTDYSSLKISANSSSTTIYNSLKALANGAGNKLDTDLGIVTFQAISLPSAPHNPATDAELVAIQTYFDNVVNTLNSVVGISVTAKAAIGGSFRNSTQSTTVDLTFTIPSNVTTAYFYQIYRSALVSATSATLLTDLTPDDELRLVFEGNPTSGDITNKFITFHDTTPEAFRVGGANLYTNANSGEGINQANEPPPFATDVALFKGSVFYANTQTTQRLELSLLSATGLNGQTLTTTQGLSSTVYTFVNQVQQVTSIVCDAGANYAAAGPADYFDIFSANSTTHYRVWFSIGTATAPSGVGVTLVPVVILNTDTNAQVATKLQQVLTTISDFIASVSTATVTVTNEDAGYTTAPSSHVTAPAFHITVTTTGTGEDAVNKKVAVSNAPTPAQEVDETARSLVRVINKQLSEVINAYYVSGSTDVPGLINLEGRTLGSGAFSLTSTIGAKFNPTLPPSGTTALSDNEVAPNRIYISKFQQPEAVPIVNSLDIGPKDQAILRILPLRDSLFILTEGGIYRISGDFVGNFQSSLFDFSTQTKAPDTAQILNNQIYMLSTQGVATISDTGVSVVSRPIENSLLPLITYPNFSSASFAVSYESDRAYILWTVSISSDAIATQAFRFNTFTNTWVTWDISKTCGIVNSDQLYLGAGDTNFIEQERKSFTRLDYADREETFTIPTSGITGKIINLGSVFDIAIGDVFVQTQKLTISQFNRLLKKLDMDKSTQRNYFSTLAASQGNNLAVKLTALVTKLNADTGTSGGYTSSGTNTFTAHQTDFNAIVAALNADSKLSLHNYKSSTGTVGWEAGVTDVDKVSKNITLNSTLPFINGDVVLLHGILSTAEWAPHALGDASMTKHVRESTIIFEAADFSNASAFYASDLSRGFTEIPFSGEGNGSWGSFAWGQSVWGGDGTSKPFRTLIPLDKQRCRYMSAKFTHKAALERFDIFGISFTFEQMSSRGYR